MTGLRQADRTSADAPAAEPVARVENADGASAILLVCEHAANHLPARFGDLGLAPVDLESHIAWDPGALGVARALSRQLDAPLIAATVSRLVLDLNRDPAAPDSVAALSERTVVPGNRDLEPAERRRRIEDVYHAFHEVADALIDSRMAAGRIRAIVSIHSFTPIYRDVPRPWHVGLIFARDGRLARHVENGLERDRDLVIGMNEPYSPADRVFHTLERHAERRGLAPLMIEIRNDLIRTAEQQMSWSNRLAPLLTMAVRHV
jgi:predicted N-formylglutamate amidohydrolase